MMKKMQRTTRLLRMKFSHEKVPCFTCILLIIYLMYMYRQSLVFPQSFVRESTNGGNVNPVAADLFHRLKSKSRVELCK